MISAQIYVIIAILALAVIALIVLLFNKNKKKRRLTFLASIAFAFIVGSIIFGDNRLIGYLLIGMGVAIAAIDIILASKHAKRVREKRKL